MKIRTKDGYLRVQMYSSDISRGGMLIILERNGGMRTHTRVLFYTYRYNRTQYTIRL